MKKFYTPVDLRSRADMTAYLENHFRYPTMNSWNQATSYACNLKVDRLGLSAGIVEKLLDMLDTFEFQEAMQDLRTRFGMEHDYLWQAGMNGRSGGYLVLYQGSQKPSGYRSYCRECGQRNYKSVSESGDVCGRCVSHSRVDYTTLPLQITFTACSSLHASMSMKIWIRRSTRRFGPKGDEQKVQQRATALKSLEAVFNNQCRRFQSFNAGTPELYRKSVQEMISTVLPFRCMRI